MKIVPLRGVLYSKKIFSNIDQVVAPPYDVISPEMQEKLYQKSSNNIVRIDFGKQSPTDSDTDNRYTRSAEIYKKWLDDEVLKKDDKPALYVYCQEFQVKGKSYSRIGFFALAKIEEPGGAIHPHEHTLAGPKQDRLNLMRACGAALSPVFSLYPGEGKGSAAIREAVKNINPLADFVDENCVRNRFWRLDDAVTCQSILELVQSKDLFIADGHHRYETARNYRNERMAANPISTGEEPYQYVLMVLVDMGDPGLAVLPTHRLVKDVDTVKLIQELQSTFDIETYSSLSEMLSKMEEQKRVFGLYSKTNGFQVAILNDKAALDEALPANRSKAWKSLDVNLLHYMVLSEVLGIGPERWEDASVISHTRDENEAVAKVDSDEFSVAFFLKSPNVDQVRQVSQAGDKMPQKSTYFYPKILTGLVLSDLNEW